MIETKEAVARVDDILSVPGIDAVYIGPADLSITLGLPPAPAQEAAVFNDALARVVESCHAHGIVPGIAGNQITAPIRIEQGFRLVEVASDAARARPRGGRGVAGGRTRARVDGPIGLPLMARG